MLRLVMLFAVLVPACVRADPLACLPKEAGVVVVVETPRDLVESFVKLEAWQKLQAFPQVKEALDSPDVKKFQQLLTFLEFSTGSKWPELIDKMAGKGIAIGFDPVGEQVIAVFEGTDEDTVKKVHFLMVLGLKEEAKRNTTLKVVESKHGETVILTVNGELHVAKAGVRTLVSNKLESLKAGLDRPLKGGESVLAHKSLHAAKGLAGPKAAGWLWFDLAAAKQRQETKDFFENTRKDLFQLLIFGSSMDAAKRADYLAAAVYKQPTGYKLSVLLPAKRSGLDDVMRLHVPKDGPGSRPLLEPPGVIASHSLYLDIGHLWKHRSKIIGDEGMRKDIEQGAEQLSKLLPGAGLGAILEKTGPYHRLVMAQTGEKLYSREPGQPIPPVAYVLSLQGGEIGQNLETILRAAGLVAAFRTGWTMSDQMCEGVKIISYRFPEKGDPKFEDSENLRFNAVPSFARVGDSLIIGSTPGIVKSLIPILKNEKLQPGGEREVLKFKVYAKGVAEVLAAYPEATVTDSLLKQGISLKEAREQVKELTKWIGTLGSVSLGIDHGDDAWRFDLEWSFQ